MWQQYWDDAIFLEKVHETIDIKSMIDALVFAKSSDDEQGYIEIINEYLDDNVLDEIVRDLTEENTMCPLCHGSGGIPEYTCIRCHGKGEV